MTDLPHYTYKAPNRHEEAARAVRVAGLIRAIELYSAYMGRPLRAAELLKYNDNEWALLAFKAGIEPPPSVTTRTAVIGALAKRDAEVAKHNEESRAVR